MRQSSIRKLMLAIAIVAVLLGIWRMFSQEVHGCRPQCQSNMRNVVLGILQYANRRGEFPGATWPNPSLPPEKRLSWYAAILPDLDNPERWEQLDKGQSWDGGVNERIAEIRMIVLRCPDAGAVPLGGAVPTQYVGIAGLGTDSPFLSKGHPRTGVFGYDRRTTLADITDGTAFTMVIAESGRVRGSWLSGGPATVRGLDTADLPYIGPGRQFGGHGSHASGMNAAFADGSIRRISESVDLRIFEASSTIAGGEKQPSLDDW